MTRYAVLFEVEIWHDYHLNRGDQIYEALALEQQAQVMAQYASADFLNVIPTLATSRTLAGQQLLFKSTATGFLVAAKLDLTSPTPRPFIPLSADFRLTFALRITDPYFFNYTALSAEMLPFHWLSNEAGNAVAGLAFLSAPVPLSNPDRAYLADELYSEPVGGRINLFRARRDTGPVAIPISGDWERIPADTFESGAAYPATAIVLAANQLFRARQPLEPGNDLNNPAQWEPLAIIPNQYVTAADSLPLKPPRFSLDLTSADLSVATVRVLRTDTSTVLWEQQFVSTNGPLEALPVALSALEPGRYSLEVLDEALVPVSALGLEFYLDGAAVRDRWFGVITIGLSSGDDALLDASGRLRSPRYRLRFLNRASRWRYRFPADQAVGAGADVAPETPDDARVLVTAQPRPLTRFGSGLRLQADVPETATVSEQVLLPEPDVRRIQRQNAQWYSDIYLLNLPVEPPAPPM